MRMVEAIINNADRHIFTRVSSEPCGNNIQIMIGWCSQLPFILLCWQVAVHASVRIKARTYQIPLFAIQDIVEVHFNLRNI